MSPVQQAVIAACLVLAACLLVTPLLPGRSLVMTSTSFKVRLAIGAAASEDLLPCSAGGSSCDAMFTRDPIDAACSQGTRMSDWACRSYNETTTMSKCLKWLSTTSHCTKAAQSCRQWTLFHLVQDSIGASSATGTAAAIASVIATQPCPIVMLWVRPGYAKAALDALWQHADPATHSVLRGALAASALRVMPLPASSRFDNGVVPQSYKCEGVAVGTSYWSDCVRLQILAIYGGLYTDTDVLLLRDLSPLMDQVRTHVWRRRLRCRTKLVDCGGLTPCTHLSTLTTRVSRTSSRPGARCVQDPFSTTRFCS